MHTLRAAAKKVLMKKRYLLTFFLVSSSALVVVILAPHVGLIYEIFQSSTLTTAGKLRFVASLLSITHGNFSIFSFSYTLLIVMLLGLNVAWLLFYINRSQVGARLANASWWQLGGFVSGVLGMGCAACGVAVLTTVLQLVGAAWLIAYLPLHGGEFGILAIILLSYSLWRLSQRIVDPLVCPI